MSINNFLQHFVKVVGELLLILKKYILVMFISPNNSQKSTTYACTLCYSKFKKPP